MRQLVETTLESQWLWTLARVCLTVVFVASGLAKLFDFEASLAEMRAAGLEPAVFFNIATAITLLLASALILLDRAVWLGAGALSVFLILTILIVHTFWNKSGTEAQLALYFALEHISVIGGLIVAAIASHLRQRNTQAVRLPLFLQS